jgi:hypothetical protein
MLQQTATAAAWLGCLFSACAQEEVSLTDRSEAIPEFDVARATFSYEGETGFDGAPGDLSISRFELRSLLSGPLKPLEGLTLIPLFKYELTHLDFDGAGAGFPINDDDLHSVSASVFALKTQQGSPWFYAGWARAEMAGDYQKIGGDDFTSDVAGGVGYRFNDRFSLALGAALANLNGDATFYPGIGFDWRVSDEIRVGLYGPTFLASYTPDAKWEFGFRGEPGGGVWNVTDQQGRSSSVDLTSYRLGVYASHRLTGKLWLTAAAGMSVGNEINLTEPNGDELFEQDLDSGLFGMVSLRLRTW